MPNFTESSPGDRNQESEETKEITDGEKYQQKIRLHKSITRNMAGLVKTQHFSEGTDEKVQDLNERRHKVHLELLELGGKLGKNEDDVTVDIVRADDTLVDYGLPEFSIMTENDILQTGLDNIPVIFNVQSVKSDKGEVMLPGDNINPEEKAKIKRRLFAARRLESLIPHGHFFLAFAIVPTRGNRRFILDDYDARFNRAKSLATELKGKFYDLMDEGWHANQTVAVLGVLFPNKDFNRVVAQIRNNPDKFRLGEEFYNQDELDEVERRKKLREPRKK